MRHRGEAFRPDHTSHSVSAGPITRKTSIPKGASEERRREKGKSCTDVGVSGDSPESDDGGSMEVVVAGGGVYRRAKRRRDESWLAHGSVSICGRRREMEDAVTVVPGFFSGEDCRFDFFAVYDGHGGSHAARTCKDRLHVLLAKELEGCGVCGSAGDEPKWGRVMKDCFGKMDDELVEPRSGGSASNKSVGSTAVVAVVGEGTIVVANCGDSRAVLSRGGVAIPLSSDHKPDRPDELERVEAAGGRVINWDGYRVLGVLATSRSIGDHYLKPYVISEPEVKVHNRSTGDEVLILASDGLWDVISNELACEVARKCLTGRVSKKIPAVFPAVNNGCRASSAAAVLVELAMARGSRDNISVVVVDLRDTKRPLR